MRKRIALLFGEISSYTQKIVMQIKKYASMQDMDVFVFMNYGIYDSTLTLYLEGERAFYRLPDYSTFDAVIVYEAMMNIEGLEDELYQYLLKNAQCPVIYYRSVRDGIYCVIHDDKKAMKDITSYLIEKYNVSDICHMSGKMELYDAKERLAGYKEAMNEAGLEVTPSMVYSGEYFLEKGKETLDFFYSSRGRYPEAIVCANDHMAYSILEELSKRGVNVPEEVLVSGYDNELLSRISNPPLTTFEMDIDGVAKAMIDIVVKSINHEQINQVTLVDDKMIMRRSTERFHDKEYSLDDVMERIHELKEESYGLDNVFVLISLLETSFSEEEIFNSVNHFYKDTSAMRSYVCLSKDAFESDKTIKDEKSIASATTAFADKVVLKRVYYADERRRFDAPEYEFDRKELLPEEYLDNKPGLYYVSVIHSGMKVFGYMVSVYAENMRPNRYLQAFTGGIARAIENFNIRSEFIDVEEMKRAYFYDTLTGLYNRKGYENNLVLLEDKAKSNNLNLSIASIDMDGLKYINDTYGHSEGDRALIEFSRVLSETLEKDEIAARYGGDEFSVILISKDPARHIRFEKKLEQELKRLSDGPDFLYPIHASVGVINTSEYPELSIAGCFKKADALMYEKKNEYKLLHEEFMR